MNEILTAKRHREIMRHALTGDGRDGRKVYRNFYCVSVGSPDDAQVETLVGLGLMRRGDPINEGKQYYAFVTPQGAEELNLELPREYR